MATSKKKSNTTQKTTPITNFRLVHEPKIIAGATSELAGWLGAGAECIKDYKGNVSAYVRASTSMSVGGLETAHSSSTMRQYISACVVAIKKAGSVVAVTEQLCKDYGYADISGLRVKYSGNGQRGKKNKSKQFDAKKEASKYTKKQLEKMLATK